MLQSDMVIDAGAHRGEDSDFYLKLGYRVVAIEANPDLCALLRERFASEIAEGRYILLETAVAEHSGPISFYVNSERSVWGTIDPEWAERNIAFGTDSRKITVEATPFADIVARHGVPHYLKVDIEGADMLCLSAFRGQGACPDYISIESAKDTWDNLVAEFDLLRDLGYTRFQVVNQKNHGRGRFRKVDGSQVDYAFGHAASGPFGQNLPGQWLTREEALKRYRFIFWKYRHFGDRTPLGSFIGRIPVIRKVLSLVGWYDTHAAR